MNRRIERINALLRQEVSRLLATELRDPRLSSLVSVTHVETSADLGSARVYVSVLGDQSAKTNTLRGLSSASGFIRRNMRQHLSLRTVPSVAFYLDESIERGDEVLRLIDDAAADPDTRETEQP